MKSIAFALLLAAATPTFAQDFLYSTLEAELASGVLDSAPEIEPSPDFLGTLDLAGGLNIALDRTPMNVVTTTFDVAPQTYQYIGYTTTWACFTAGGRRVWYIADQTYEIRDDIYISTIVDEPADPATDEMFRCKPEPKAIPKAHPALPAIGSTLAELNAFYKVTMPAGTRYFGGYGSPTTDVTTSVYYRLTDGVVDAISIAGGYAFEEVEEEAHLNGMAEEVVASEWADPITLDEYLFEPIDFDLPSVQTSFLLDTAYLSQVLSVFGGTAHTEEIFEETPITWACYDTGNGRTTFVSLRTGEGDDSIEPPIEPGPIANVIVEEANAPTNDTCSESLAAAAPLPGNDIPRLGATRIELFNRFGGDIPERDSHLAYVTQYEMGDEGNWLEHKVIYYQLENGLVTGVAYKLYATR